MKKLVFKKSTSIIVAIVITVIALAFLGNYAIIQNNEKTLVGSKWELDYAAIRNHEFEPSSAISNLTLNNNKTFIWNVVYDDGELCEYKGTYSINNKGLEIKYPSGSTESYPITIHTNGKLSFDKGQYKKVAGNFEKTSVYVNKTPASAPVTNTTSSNTNTTNVTYNCALTGCPNKTNTSGAYCSVHAKGKTNTCKNCGTKIWADETYCDDCLFGNFDFTEYGIDY